MAKKEVQSGERLPENEIEEINSRFHYEPGKPYQFILTQGWVVVGYFVRMESPVEIRVAHASYYRSAGNQTHASLAQNGGNKDTAWEYMGETCINKMQVIMAPYYHGKVNHGRIS